MTKINVQEYMRIAQEIQYLPTVESYRIPSDDEIKEVLELALHLAREKRKDMENPSVLPK